MVIPASLRAYRIAFVVFAQVLLLSSLTIQIKSTGAVPGDEFHAAGLLYGVIPAMRILGNVLGGLAFVLALGAARALPPGLPRWIAWLQALIVPLAPLAPAPILAVLLLISETFVLVGLRQGLAAAPAGLRKALEEQAETLGEVGLRRLVSFWPWLAAMATMAALLVVGVESATYSTSFLARGLFPAEALHDYRLRMIDLCAIFGAGLGFAYLVPVTLGTLMPRLLRRRGGLAVHAHLWPAAALSLGLVLFTRAGLLNVFGDEIEATRVRGHAETWALFLFFFLFHSIRSNLVALGSRRHDGSRRTAGEIWSIAALGLFGLPASALPKPFLSRPRPPFAAWMLAGCVLFAALVYGAYPELEDFRSKLIALGVVTAVHAIVLVIVAGGLLLTGGRAPSASPRVRAVLAVLLLGLAAFSLRPIASGTALIVHEYARFGYIIKRASLREVLRPADELGRHPASRTFEVHGAGEDRLPEDSPIAAGSPPPPIFLVLWDAGRPDRMGCYGNPRPTSPNLDRLARESVVFERAYSGATATSCGVRHIYTGRYSSRFMLQRDHDPFFVHALRRHGYLRFYLTAFGTDYNGVSIEAFQRKGPALDTDGAEFFHLTRHPTVAEREVNDRIKVDNLKAAWRKARAERGEGALDGSFSFLHLTGTHFPWSNADPVQDFGRGWRDLYDGEMAKCDALTEEAFATLREIGAFDSAIIVLLADHGTGLMEHGRWAGFLPYEEQIRVPLVIRVPGVTPRRVRAPVATIDLAPTLVGFFEPGAANEFDGASLWPLMSGRKESLTREDQVSLCAFEDAYALLHAGRWKLHYHRAEDYHLLFDLQEDPEEKRNLADSRPEIAADLIRRLDAFLWRGRSGYGNPWHYRDWTPPIAPTR